MNKTQFVTEICFDRMSGKATFNKVNIFTNQKETLMKYIQKYQKSIAKSISAYGFLKSQEKPN